MLLVVLAAAGGAFFWWRHQVSAPPPVPVSIAPTAVPTVPVPPPSVPAIRYPVASPSASARDAPPSIEAGDSYLKNALIDLLGRKSILSVLRLDSIIRRLVATIDNLGTDNAAASMWPAAPTAGPFETEPTDGGVAISAKNADRYIPFVRLAEGVDVRRVVRLYVRLYPLFQRAYEDLGYPGKYFNDRVVEVIDTLLATPVVAEPIKVKRIGVDGAVGSGPGLYVFDDPVLEGRSAGQKILLRMGRANAAKLMAKLADARRLIAADGAAWTPNAR